MASFAKALVGTIVGATALLASSSVFALPALQLGPGGGDWTYCGTCTYGSNTWVTGTSPVSLSAYANARDGFDHQNVDVNVDAHGAYAWDPTNLDAVTNQYAYLILAAVPKQADPSPGPVVDYFNAVFEASGTSATQVGTGYYGAPPISDPIGGHGIYETYYELWQFQFDGSPVEIGNTSPGGEGGTDPGDGYVETFDITISLLNGAVGVHFDLITAVGDGVLSVPAVEDVKKFAPFSHDATYDPTCTDPSGCRPDLNISEPAPLAALGFGLLVLGYLRRRQMR